MQQALEHLQGHPTLLQGKTALVTGGNRGLGKAIAARLLCLGAHVVVTSRTVNAEATAAVLQAAAALPGCQLTEDHLKLVPLDLADLRSVAAAASAIPSHLHIVILNAGLAPQEGATTEQGFELAFGVNCIGHYALVRHLVAQGVFGAPHDRLVVVTSESARAAAPLDLADLFAPASFGMMEGMAYYARSKLAVNTVTTWLTQALEPRQVQVHSICPGPVATDIARQTPIYFRVVVDALMKLFFQTADQASWPVRTSRTCCGRGGGDAV
jgi:NAD(P)-dependent dehydrogenase (short-subunit alcohol dehydrogenase family)